MMSAPTLRRHACKLVLAMFATLAVPAWAADITVVSAAAVIAPVTELAAEFERSSGHHVKLDFTTAGGVDGKVKSDARFDIVINARERLDALAAAKLVATGAARDLGVVKIGVAVRKGGQKPDLSSVDAFRASLLKAQSISYGDPAKGPTTGIHFAKVIERLGIVDAMQAKSQLVANGLEVMKLVSSGKAELGITQISEIMHVQGDTLVGPLPEQLQLNTTYSVTLGSDAASAAVRQFADLLVSAAGRERFQHAGFQ